MKGEWVVRKIIIVIACLWLCCISNPVRDGTVHHFKSVDAENTRYYVEIESNFPAVIQYLSFIDKSGKYSVGDTIIYMTKSEY